MRISIDFGITVIDSLAQESNGNLQHHMMLSEREPDELLINEILNKYDPGIASFTPNGPVSLFALLAKALYPNISIFNGCRYWNKVSNITNKKLTIHKKNKILIFLKK